MARSQPSPLGLTAPAAYVPNRCFKSPNSVYDRDFGIHICGENNHRCAFFGPVFILDQEGRHHECRKKDLPQ